MARGLARKGLWKPGALRVRAAFGGIDFFVKGSIMALVECEAYPYDDVDRGVSHPFSSARKGGGFVLDKIVFPMRGCSFICSCYNQNAVAGEHSLNNKKGGLPPPPLPFARHV